MASGVSLGRLFGVRIRLDWSALVIALFVAIQLWGRLGGAPAIVVSVGFLASILAHELGHAVVARQFGVPTEEIRLWALGGVAQLTRPSPTPKAEASIAFAGPLVSLLVGFSTLWIGLAIYDPIFTSWHSAFINLGLLNLVLGVFNLLPGAPLDGGRLVRAARWRHHGDRYRATRESARAGTVLAVIIGVLGLLAPLGGGGLWLLITAAFLWASAKVELVGADIGEALAGVTVGEMTWYGVAEAGPDMDADSLLWQRRRLGSAGGVSVTDEDGRAVGVALEEEMWKIPADERPRVMLPDLAIPFDQTIRARPTDELASVIGTGRRMLITVWDGDALVGMVPPNRLKERLAPFLGGKLTD